MTLTTSHFPNEQRTAIRGKVVLAYRPEPCKGVVTHSMREGTGAVATMPGRPTAVSRDVKPNGEAADQCRPAVVLARACDVL